MESNHDQMVHTPDGNTVVVKAGDDRSLQSNQKPEFSFDYDSLRFSTSIKEYTLGGVVFGMSAEEQQELIAYLATVEEDSEITARVARTRKCEEYLNATDWYVVRKMETGAAIPAEVTTERDACRAYLGEMSDKGFIERLRY